MEPGKKVGSPRVIVAEDHPVSVDILVHLVGLDGISPVVVDNGTAAVDLVTRESWDLILMDVQMPGMDGLEATRRIRALPGGAALPIIALTAAGADEQRAACLNAGFTDVMTKPIGPLELHSLLARLLPNLTGRTAASRPEDLSQELRQQLASITNIDFDLGLAGVGGMPQVFHRMLERFVEVHRTGGTRTMDNLDGSDMNAVQTWMHAFSGPAALLGMTDLARRAGRLSRSAPGQQLDAAALGATLASFKADLEKILAALTTAMWPPQDAR